MYEFNDILVFYFLMLCWNLTWGWLTYTIGVIKNIKGFWIGFFFNIIGVIIILLLPSRPKLAGNALIITNKCSDKKTISKADNYINGLSLIKKLTQLKISGAITEEEFEDEKRKILR